MAMSPESTFFSWTWRAFFANKHQRKNKKGKRRSHFLYVSWGHSRTQLCLFKLNNPREGSVKTSWDHRCAVTPLRTLSRRKARESQTQAKFNHSAKRFLGARFSSAILAILSAPSKVGGVTFGGGSLSPSQPLPSLAFSSLISSSFAPLCEKQVF